MIPAPRPPPEVPALTTDPAPGWALIAFSDRELIEASCQCSGSTPGTSTIARTASVFGSRIVHVARLPSYVFRVSMRACCAKYWMFESIVSTMFLPCLLYTSDAADDL